MERTDNPGNHAIRIGRRNGRYELHPRNDLHAFERYAPTVSFRKAQNIDRITVKPSPRYFPEWSSGFVYL